MNNKLQILYRINSRDEIVFVNDQWTRFALANNGSNFLPNSVLHQSLWNFISDSTTEFLYREILRKVRAGKSMQFNFRCDSPRFQCLLEMTVSPQEGGDVEFATQTLWTKKRRAPQILFDSDIARTEDMLIICSWCKKVNTGNEVWQEVEEAVKTLGLFELENLPRQSHGMCKTCYQTMSENLEKLRTP